MILNLVCHHPIYLVFLRHSRLQQMYDYSTQETSWMIAFVISGERGHSRTQETSWMIAFVINGERGDGRI